SAIPWPRRRKKTAQHEELVSESRPALPVRDTVLYPHVVTPLFIDRDRSLRAVDAALGDERTLLVVAQRSSEIQQPGAADLYEVGTEAVVGRVLKMPDGTTSILVQGQRRVKLLELVQDEPYLQARVAPLDGAAAEGESVEPLMRAVLGIYEKVTKLSRSVPDDHYVAAMNIDEAGWLADFVISDLELPIEQRQDILETSDELERLHKVSVFLAKELEVLELQNKIHSQVQLEVDKNQREYFLREQLKAIQNELGEADAQSRDIAGLREKIAAAGMPDEVRAKAEEELERLVGMPAMSPEVGMVRSYPEWLVNLPWGTETGDQLGLKPAA